MNSQPRDMQTKAQRIITLREQVEALIDRKLEAISQDTPDWTAIADIEGEIARLHAEISVLAGDLAKAVQGYDFQAAPKTETPTSQVVVGEALWNEYMTRRDEWHAALDRLNQLVIEHPELEFGILPDDPRQPVPLNIIPFAPMPPNDPHAALKDRLKMYGLYGNDFLEADDIAGNDPFGDDYYYPPQDETAPDEGA